VVLVLACSDGSFPNEPTSGIDVPLLSEVPSEVPPEFDRAPSIYSAVTDVGFDLGVVYAQGVMRAWANRMRQTTTLNALFDGDPLTTISGTEESSTWLPSDRGLITSVAVGVERDCGHSGVGQTQHSAWHQFPLTNGEWFRWGEQARSTDASSRQTGCQVDDPDEDGEDGGGDDPGIDPYGEEPAVISWTRICHFTDVYDAETGEFLYRIERGCYYL
jgi:hypothetical protein